MLTSSNIVPNIYDSNYSEVNNEFVNQVAEKRYRDSREPAKTGIIPNNYNQIHGKEPLELFNINSNSFYDKVVKFQEPFETNLKRKQPKNEFLSQFEDLTFDNPNEPHSSNGNVKNNNVAQMEYERRMALDGGYSLINNDMDYGVSNSLEHLNMVPFYSARGGEGNGYGNHYDSEAQLNSVKQRKLDMFTGSLKNLDYRPKTERRPLFNPLVGLTNIYGMPNFTEFMQGRYIPSKERRNEKPFQEVKVTPGLNLGYNEVGKQGFHDPYRVLPKTVDELRTANNPKLSYTPPVIAGMKGDKRGSRPTVAKRRPERFTENDPRNLQKSMGYIKAPRAPENFNVQPTNRQMTAKNNYLNPMRYYAVDGVLPESQLPKVKISHKENFDAPVPRGIGHVEAQKATGFKESYNNKPTIRSITEKNTYLNHPAPYEHHKPQAFDMKTNIPDPTLRNLIEHMTTVQPVGTAEHAKSYAFDKKTNIPDPTMRNIHEKLTMTQPIGTAEHAKTYAFDKITNIPDPTMRNIHEKMTITQPLGTAEHAKPQAFDKKTNIPDPTMRNIHEKMTITQPLGTAEHAKPQAFDKKTNIPDPTMRNISEKKTWINPAVFHEAKKRPAFDEKTNIPDPTHRNTYEVNTYINPMFQDQAPEQRNRRDYRNAYININAEAIEKGRAPTTSNYSKTPIYEHMNVELCEPIQINRDRYPNMNWQNPTQCIPTMYTRRHTPLPQQSDHFWMYPDENLKNNPYINNVVHKSVSM